MVSISRNKDQKVSISLQEAFTSTFHDKIKFEDFLNIDIQEEYKEIRLKNRRNTVNPSKVLRKYLKFLNSFIFDFAKINTNVVFSYREGKNAFGAVEKHSQNSHFVQTDIKGFFNSIHTEDLAKIIDKNLSDSPINDIYKYKEHLLTILMVDNHLPVGFSTSPNISNTFLYGFDNIFEEFCIDKGITYTRYADDLIMSSKKADNLIETQKFISDTLNGLFGDRVQLNSHKTKLTKKGRKIKLLGMVILPSGKVTVDQSLKSEIEALLHFYVSDKTKFADYLEKIYDGKISRISGKLNYINTVDKDYLNKLRSKYGNYVIDGFCHQTINKL